ncbi:MAG: AsmA family protein [Deltaproteobacteria bacterium]|nr:AsmA family protein [Deltaproteobacteria bacterium]
MARRLWIAAGATLALLVLAALLALLALDGMLKRAIERRGTALTGTAVTVEHVEVSLLDGGAAVQGLRIANPPGYRTPHALTLDEATASLSLASLFSSPIVVHAIELDGVRVFFELDAQGNPNLDVIRRHLEKKPPPGAPPPTRVPGTRTQPRGEGRRFVVERLTLHDGHLALDARATGGPVRDETLEGFELTNLGADRPGGATPRQLAREVGAAIARDVAVSLAASQVEKWLGKDVGGAVGDLLKKGGAGAIEKGLGGWLEKLMKKDKRDR